MTTKGTGIQLVQMRIYTFLQNLALVFLVRAQCRNLVVDQAGISAKRTGF